MSVVVSEALKKAENAHRAGDFGAAESYYMSHLMAAPSDADALYLMGVLFLQTRRPKKAAEVLAKALEINPRHGRAQYSAGRAASLLGRDSDAVAHYRASLNSGLRQADTYVELTMKLVEMGQHDGAKKVARTGLKAFPNDPKILCALAQIEMKFGNPSKAISLYKRAMRASPDDPEILYYLGIALMRDGREEEAVEALSKVIQTVPAMWRAHSSLGSAMFALGRFDDARKTLQKPLLFSYYLRNLKVSQ